MLLYPRLCWTGIQPNRIIVNAQFVDSVGDTSEATWIGKLAVISQLVHKKQTVIFDSITRDVIIFGYGKIKSAVIKSITFYENGKVKCIQAVKKQGGNPTVHVEYINKQAIFDVEFHKDHLDVKWDLHYDKLHELGGLIGKHIIMYYIIMRSYVCMYMYALYTQSQRSVFNLIHKHS